VGDNALMQLKKFDSMNVVPFIDIMLVLLVIVLTTATFVARGIIPVNLSKAKSANTIKEKKRLVITIKQDGAIFFDKEQIAKDKVETKLLTYKKQSQISINCDKNAKFDNFVYILDILKNSGFKNVGVITKNE
jgi:biopolymer transport protein ExbD